MKKVAFVCVYNSCGRQIAEALGKLVDELAKGKPMEKILRK